MKTLQRILASLTICLLAMAASAQTRPVVQFIATGGTIAMKIDPVTRGVVPAISGDDLMQTVPDAGKYATIEVNNFSNMSANYVEAKWWTRLTNAVDDALARPEVAGVVIAHGTDTMEETAYWLDLTVKSDKPVILIGAQRNASSPDFDGPRNLLNAIRIATTPEARGKGVMLAMNNQINAARSVTKTHTGNVETFKSGDFGLLGEVWDDKVIFARAPLRRQRIEIGTAEMPRVEILAMFGGADGSLLRYAVDQGAKGIVVQALGMGNMNVSMFEAVKYALSKNVPVVVATRVPNGRTMPLYGFVGGGKTSYEAGAVMAGDLSPQKARLLLMLLLQRGTGGKAELQAAFDR
ncbi:L-asparaginase [Variovorax sp. WS11]|uniref:asparaginase n=1 Tax=Variovorax sp. WS11 TaxID=1105204 RepID=UPI000D0E1C88|nr:asparaginase [Variovorax sp. WS11]NDZ17430.1 asparaginase [Variovorax sp. WS11]PSL86034.1 L-asparaginase [Variovorax sp. WS11]